MKKTHIFGIVLVGILLAAMLILVGDFSSYETFETASENPDKDFHVIGYLDTLAGKMDYDPIRNPNEFIFYAKDKKGEIRKVIYHDSKPQDFEKSEQLVMIGRIDGSTFVCKELLMKCPSKYQDGNGPKPDKDGYINANQNT